MCIRDRLENLNLRGGFKANIMGYIKSYYPHLFPLYEEIYLHKDRTYWKQLEQQAAKMAQEAAKMAQEAQCKYCLLYTSGIRLHYIFALVDERLTDLVELALG